MPACSEASISVAAPCVQGRQETSEPQLMHAREIGSSAPLVRWGTARWKSQSIWGSRPLEHLGARRPAALIQFFPAIKGDVAELPTLSLNPSGSKLRRPRDKRQDKSHHERESVLRLGQPQGLTVPWRWVSQLPHSQGR